MSGQPMAESQTTQIDENIFLLTMMSKGFEFCGFSNSEYNSHLYTSP